MLRRRASAKQFKLHRISSYSECMFTWLVASYPSRTPWIGVSQVPIFIIIVDCGWVVKFPCIAANQIKSPKWFLSQIDRPPVCFNPDMLAVTSHMCLLPQQAVAGNKHMEKTHHFTIIHQCVIYIYNICGNKMKVLNGINHSYPLFPWFSDEKTPWPPSPALLARLSASHSCWTHTWRANFWETYGLPIGPIGTLSSNAGCSTSM